MSKNKNNIYNNYYDSVRNNFSHEKKNDGEQSFNNFEVENRKLKPEENNHKEFNDFQEENIQRVAFLDSSLIKKPENFKKEENIEKEKKNLKNFFIENFNSLEKNLDRNLKYQTNNPIKDEFDVNRYIKKKENNFNFTKSNFIFFNYQAKM